ncbi:endonuclease/exonuclease/phosphatase family protein [Pontibacter sp. G13]|uniref:endonuclease/exonuclease/phosphatase family protein n=1 Tax=Pontibacter sp. G13 TaxID=3074898 RepID=UPI00288A95A0|nr:endonuclease/exonuclease/phosphatase family protein [Pontibacter sp. G13]WNJ21384.1 endonuclease/exonuclease/phosphatase family protein [Pontibacter sp. G13]
MTKRIIRIGTFNLFNLVLPNHRFYGKRRYSEGKYLRKINWVAQQLDRMRADIVGFQEVFHQEALVDAVNTSHYLRGAHVIAANPSGRKPVVGLASKYPIEEWHTLEDFEEVLDIDDETLPAFKFRRPILRAVLRIRDDLNMIVYVVHLKSKRPDVPEGVDPHDNFERAKGQARSLVIRAAESIALRSVIMDDLRGDNDPLVLLGDLNDSSLAVTSRLISGEPPLRKFPIESKRDIWDVLLYHAQDIQARKSMFNSYYTHIHNGHHESLDHIMVSQELVQEYPKHVGRIGSFRVFNDHLVDETVSEEMVPYWMSDHGQVVATIELR